MSLLFQSKYHCIQRQSRRYFWQWMINVFNKPDPQRLQEVGADRAAAEWLIKNGAAVKWTDSHHWVKDYDLLEDDVTKRSIKEIDATNSSITHIGFPHLNGLHSLDTFIIKNNGYIEDNAIEINLKHLKLFDLPSVKDREKCLKDLKSGLKCEIDWKEAKPKKLL
ncbi:unnamed protein product [Oppiella nova]|uniref:ATP synthase subunit s, mitochondrial n=1 Tax=Oppiella nova TaxID=334625 RepID=A0A7R9ML84_9ACAR|nr:unnamed protein product [Oppiella nova]CAG2179464.1 unnamed protein product [Oppiella nova]